MVEFLSLPLSVLIFPGGLFALGLGLLIKGLDRKVAARLQRRVGPPLLQPFFDLIKLAGKDSLIPVEGHAGLFRWVPLAGPAAMALAAAMIPIAGVYRPSAGLGDLLVLFYLLAVPAVVLMLAGAASGSPFGAIGFSREMTMMIAYELPILLVLLSVAVAVGMAQGGSIALSLSDIVAYQQVHGPFIADPRMWPALLCFLFFLPATLGAMPFDSPEAETEILEGPLLDYSGPLLGVFKMMSALKLVVVLGLGVTFFFPNGPDGILGLGVFAIKCAVLAILSVTVVRVSTGRMRIDQAFRFFLKLPLALGTASLVIVLSGI